MSKKYEVLEHKADLKIQVFGETKEEIFSNALLGMTESLKPDIKSDEKINKFDSAADAAKITRQIKIESPDLAALLVDFLSEVLYLIQTNKEIYNEVKFNKFTDTNLEAELFGQKVARFNEDIKAVTYHQLDIHQKEDGTWEATILFDI